MGGGCVCVCVCVCVHLTCVRLFRKGFALASPCLALNDLKIPPPIQENKYARLVILLQLSLPADGVTWSLEPRRLAFWFGFLLQLCKPRRPPGAGLSSSP